MITIKIKDTNPIGSRVISIRSRKMRILGMNRALTVTENNYTNALKEANLPQHTFPHDIFEMRREFSIKKLNDMLKKKGDFSSVVRQVRPFTAQNAARITVFRPIIKEVSPVSWDKIRAALEVGIFGSYDVIAVPDFHFKDMHAYEEHITKSREHIYTAATSMKKYFEQMPSLTVANNTPTEIKSKLKVLKDLGVNAINIENADFLKYYAQYNAIREFAKDTDILLYGSEVKRVWNKTKASLMHIYPFFGIDVVALAKPPRAFLVDEGQRSVHDRPKSRAKIYDPETDGILSRGEYNLLHGEQLKSKHYPLLANETLTSTFNRFDNQLLMKVTKLHESIECWYELQKERNAVINGDYIQMMKQKKCIAPVMQMVRQRTL